MNVIDLSFQANIENEKMMRLIVSSLLANKDISSDELMEIKTIVSEAIVNAIVHGLHMDSNEKVYVHIEVDDEIFSICVEDHGEGIKDLDLALTPMYSSLKDSEHTGMGFTIMSVFADEFHVDSASGKGTKVYLRKNLHCL